MKMVLAILLLTPVAAYAQVPRLLLPDFDTPSVEELQDPAVLAERIAKNSKSVSDRLSEAKTEPETLRDQKQITTDLDALIKLLDQPPPPSASPPPPSGSPPPQPPKDKPGESKPKQGESPPKGGQPPPMGREAAAPKPPKEGQAAAAEPGKSGASLPTLSREESLSRDFWGHLPDAQRAQMLQFYREQYMTKYKDLLADYYQSLAEKEKKSAK